MILGLLLASALSVTAASDRPAVAAPFARAARQDAAKPLEELWGQLGAALNAQELDSALTLTKLVVDHPAFADEPPVRRRAARYILGLLYAEAGQHAVALPLLIESSEQPALRWMCGSLGSTRMPFCRT